MESVDTLIPDNEGNHLVVVLTFYDEYQKTNTFQIPSEFTKLEIADIAIEKLNLEQPLGQGALYRMCRWLIEQFLQFPTAVFTFICSTAPLETKHAKTAPEQYRWNLFEALYMRNAGRLEALGIESKDIIVGPDGYQTFAKVFYRTLHAPVIHLVEAHISNKYH